MKLAIFILCLISCFVCGLYNVNNNYEYIIFLPISLTLFNAFDNFLFSNLKRSYVYYIFYFQAIIRYCVIPVGIAMGDVIATGKGSFNHNIAVLFMIIELLFIFLLFLYNDNKFKNKIRYSKVQLVDKNTWLYVFITIMFLIVLTSGFFSKVNLIWNLKTYVTEVIDSDIEVESSSIGGLLFTPLKIALLLIVSSFILKSKTNQNYKALSILVVMGLASSFIVGMSRLSIISFILPFYFIILKLLKKKAIKIINVGFSFFLVGIILMASLAKFSRWNKEASTESILNTTSYNAYFAGVGNIAAGIDSFEERPNKEYALFFINDIFQNVPLLSKLTNNNYKSNYVFNKKIYGHGKWQTQIVPLSIAGLFHFDVWGVGVYSCLFLSLAFYFEKKAQNEPYLPYKYVFYSLMLSLSMVFMLNIGSMIATVFRSFAFVYFPFYLSNKLNRLI